MAEYVNPNALVDSDWVAAHGGDEGVRLVEVDVDTSSYDSGHIPGAVGWNWETQLSDGVRRDIASPEQWAELLESSGISADTHVILYGDNNNWFAAFAYWQFKLAGHDRVSLMNGGRLKWEQEGHELTTAPPDVERSSYAAGEADPSLRVLQPGVRAAVGDGSTVMVDVRSPAEFTGEILAPPGLAELAQRGGHIPGADNVPWLTAVNEDGRHVQVRRRIATRSTVHAGRPATRRSLPTAGSASVPRTPGLRCTNCSASRMSAITTARGRNGAR